MTFAERLKAARVAAGKTQLRLSIDAGFSTSAVSGYESGKANPTVETIRRFERALGVRLSGEADK